MSTSLRAVGMQPVEQPLRKPQIVVYPACLKDSERLGRIVLGQGDSCLHVMSADLCGVNVACLIKFGRVLSRMAAFPFWWVRLTTVLNQGQ
jgi:hypothetical protein